jgi:hypothetical protein
MDLILIILILIFLIILWYLINIDQNYKEPFTNNKKPYLWVYWELVDNAKVPPPYISLCLDIMKQNTSDVFDIKILDEKSVFGYLPDLRSDINELPIALKTDYIRVRLLKTYGGVWIDADTICINDLKVLADKLNQGVDYIGVGCTGVICKDGDGYGKPSNGLMGSIPNGRLISKCAKALDDKLNAYYKIHANERKQFDYFELGKKIIWEQYDLLIKEDPTYKMYHIPMYADGTRDIDGKWVAMDLIFTNHIKYEKPDELMIVMLANSVYCSKDPKYNWFCGMSREDILKGKYFISGLFNRALKYKSSYIAI